MSWWCWSDGGENVVEVVAPHHVLPPCFLPRYWQLAARHSQTVDIWFLHWSDKYPVIQCFHSQNSPPATAQQVGRRRREKRNCWHLGRFLLVPVYIVSVLTGIDPCLHCIAGELSSHCALPYHSSAQGRLVHSGLVYHQCIIIISDHGEQNLLIEQNFWIFIFFFPNTKILMDLLA